MFICSTIKHPIPLSRSIVAGWIILFAYIMVGCRPGQQPVKTHPVPIADTFDASATYEMARHLDTRQADALYKPFIQYLLDEDSITLLKAHLPHWEALSSGQPELKAQMANTQGYIYHYEAEYDSARSYFETAIRLFQQQYNDSALASVFLNMANNHSYQGNFDSALAYRFKALETYKKLGFETNYNRARSDIATDLYYLKEVRRAIDTAASVLQYYSSRQDTFMMGYLQSILATCYYNLKIYDTAEVYALQSLSNRRQTGMAREIGESLNNLSLAYMAQKKTAAAIDVLEESLRLMQQAGDQRQMPIITQNLAAVYIEAGQTARGEAMLHEVIATATRAGQKDALANAYKKLYTLHRDRQQFEDALQYYQQYKAWKDTLLNEEKARTIGELQIKYQTSQQQAQIAQLRAEKKLDTTRKGLYLALALLITTIAALVTGYLMRRNRQHRQLVQQVREELAVHQNALQSFTENIRAKNRFIEELETKLLAAANEPVAGTEPAPIAQPVLSELYQFRILTEEDWIAFKILFDKVHPGFLTRLRQQFPSLAAGDERQALLIKLNIDNKECAAMLGISADSVKKNRYRLKKKFNLSEQDRLDDFVRDFE